MNTNNVIPFFHSYREQCWKTQFVCCGVNNDNNIHIHWERYFIVMNNHLYLSYNPLQRKINNNDEHLLYANVSNEANGTITSFMYNGECLLNVNLIQCKGETLLYHVDR